MSEILLSEAVWLRTLQAASSLLWVALGGYLCFRAGIVHVGLEGTMLVGAFAGVAASSWAASSWLGSLGGAAAGAALGAVFGILVVTYRSDMILVGIALNVFAVGATAVALQIFFGVRGGYQSPSIDPLVRLHLPLLQSLPWLGQVISGQSVLTYLIWILYPLTSWWLRSTRAGLTLRVVGQRAEIAEAIHRRPKLIQITTLIVGGAFMGLGGVQLALGDVALFTENMTSGRGFVILAILFVVGPRIWALASLCFGYAVLETFGFALQAEGFPSQLTQVTPFVGLLVVMLVMRMNGSLHTLRAQLDRQSSRSS